MNQPSPRRTGVGPARGRPLYVAIFTALSLSLIVAGCLPMQRDPGSGWEIEDRGGGEFVLRVENHNFLDARLYVRWNGDRRRIGVVGGNQNRDFTLPYDGRSLRVEVDFVAGRGFVSGSTSVNPGDTINFRIPASAR
jgi:hypothetical protein